MTVTSAFKSEALFGGFTVSARALGYYVIDALP
jgi:hypothetical protein